MPQESPQAFPTPLFVCPVWVKLSNASFYHGSRGSMGGIGHGDPFCRRLRRKNGRIGTVDHFNPKLFHWRRSE